MTTSARNHYVNLLFLIGQPLLLNALSIPAMAYIIHLLGATRFGQWAVGVSLVGVMAVLTNLGLRTLFVREIARLPEQAERAISEQLGLRTLLAICAMAIALLASIILRYPAVIGWCVAINGLGLVASSAGSVLADYLQGIQRFRAFATMNMVSGLVLTLLSVIAVYFRAGPVGLSAAYLIGPLFSLGILFWIIQRLNVTISLTFSLKRFGHLLNEVRHLAGPLCLSQLQLNIEQLLVPKVVGVTDFGLFSAGTIPANRLTAFPDGLATNYYSRIARDHETDPASASRHVSELLIMSLVICVPTALLVSFLAVPIASILFPNHIQACAAIMKTTVYSIPILSVAYTFGFSLQAIGQHRQAAQRTTIGTLIAIISSSILIARFHILGACWSMVLRPAVTGSLLLPLFRRSFPSAMERLPFVRLALCSAIMAISLRLCAGTQFNHWAVIIIGAMFGILSYSVAIVCFGITKPKIDFLSSIFRTQAQQMGATSIEYDSSGHACDVTQPDKL